MTLNGKTMVVTGGSGALGRVVAASALARGAKVVALDLRFDGPAADGVRSLAIDLLDASAVATAVAGIGPIDALCNIAGGFAIGASAHDGDDAQWDRMMAMNVTTGRNMIKAVVPGMIARGMGRIVNVGAYGALRGRAAMGAYTASKAVVMNLTQTLAAELKATGITVNAVLPTTIDTPANRQAMPGADTGGWVAPEDLASVICFLASDEARAVTGVLLPVTGRGEV